MVIENNRAHPDVCGLTDGAGTRDIGARHDAAVITDAGVVPDQRSTIQYHVAADRRSRRNDDSWTNDRPFANRAVA